VCEHCGAIPARELPPEEQAVVLANRRHHLKLAFGAFVLLLLLLPVIWAMVPNPQPLPPGWINLTPAAHWKAVEIVESRKAAALRVTIEPGIGLALFTADRVESEDRLLREDDLQVVVDSALLDSVKGLEIDWRDGHFIPSGTAPALDPKTALAVLAKSPKSNE
jgi:Fe-S cluster assembly iron-binding protein IscA